MAHGSRALTFAALAATAEANPAGAFYCPPLEPISDRCWHNYGIKWVRTYILPTEQDGYHDLFSSGIYRTAEMVREQVIDRAIDEVMTMLRQLSPVAKVRKAMAALSALHGIRYALCAVEFQDCYESHEVTSDGVDTFCIRAEEALTELEIQLPHDHASFCTAFLVPNVLEGIVQSVVEVVRSEPEEGLLFKVPVFAPAAYSPEFLCHPETMPLGALTNADFAEGDDLIDYRGQIVPQLSIESILKRIHRAKQVDLSRWVVNLGAYDGLCGRGTECYDPANCLVEEQHFNGVLVEGNDTMAWAMHQRFKAFDSTSRKLLNDVVVVSGPVTPPTVVDMVFQYLTLLEVDLLKVDVDSMPHDELIRMLLEAGLRPKVIHTEVGPWFPPPVSYWRSYKASDSLVYAEKPVVVGVNPSLARVDSVVRPYGYELLQVELYDAVWIRAEYMDAFGSAAKHSIYEKWLVGAFCHPGFMRFGENHKLGRYDFRAWANPSIPLEDRGQYMEALLRRALGDDDSWHLSLKG